MQFEGRGGCGCLAALLTNRALCHKKRKEWDKVAADSRAALKLNNKFLKVRCRSRCCRCRRRRRSSMCCLATSRCALVAAAETGARDSACRRTIILG